MQNIKEEKKYLKLVDKATEALKKGKTAKAKKLLDEALPLFPERFEAMQVLGNYYGTVGDYQAAMDCHDEAIRINMGSAAAYHNKGLCLLLLNHRAEAINCFKSAINLDRNLLKSYQALINELVNDGQELDAYHFLLEALEMHPDDGTLNFMLAVLVINNGDGRISSKNLNPLQMLDKAENKGIDIIQINFLRGSYFHKKKEWETAAKYLSRALNKNYDEEYAGMYADALIELGMYDVAIGVIREMQKEGSAFANTMIQENPSLFVNN